MFWFLVFCLLSFVWESGFVDIWINLLFECLGMFE